jgi:hypothetical protein
MVSQLPCEHELKNLSQWACDEWKHAFCERRLECAVNVANGTECVGISGNRFVRNGFIKDDIRLGCKNTKSDGSTDYCCTFAVVAVLKKE